MDGLEVASWRIRHSLPVSQKIRQSYPGPQAPDEEDEVDSEHILSVDDGSRRQVPPTGTYRRMQVQVLYELASWSWNDGWRGTRTDMVSVK